MHVKTLLSPALQELLQLCANEPDASCSDLARRLFRSKKTVRTQLNVIYERLGVKSKAGAIIRGLQYNLITFPPIKETDIQQEADG